MLENASFLYTKVLNMNISKCITTGAKFHDYNIPTIIGSHKARISVVEETPSSIDYLDQDGEKDAVP
jgi:hypothetical protein